MGIEPFLLAASLKLVIAQRLVRTLCVDCKDNSELEKSKCTSCNGRGYRGRRGLFEFLPITDIIRELIHDGAAHSAFTKLPEIKDRTTLELFGANLVRQQFTSNEEVQRVVQ